MHRCQTLPRRLLAASFAVALAVPIGLLAMPQAAAAKVYDGPDVASYQHPNPTKKHPHGQPINWRAVRKSGKEFAIVKASEGSAYVNPYFDGPYFRDYPDARAAGLVHGAYHFARPTKPIVSSANQQAKFFASVIGTVTTHRTLPPALDLEVNGGLSRAQLVTWAQDFLLKLRSLTDRTPMLYTYPAFWTGSLADPKALARYPLWMAHYGTKQAPVADLWQYTSTAHVKGIIGAVDLSRFVGATGFPWKTLSDGTVSTPWSPAPPHAPLSAAASIAGTTATVHWMPGDAGTSRVTKYVVQATPGNATQTVSGTHFSAAFPNLHTGTSYSFTIRAVNAVDTGPVSKPTNSVVPVLPTKLSVSVPTDVAYGGALAWQAKLTRSDTKAALANKRILLFRRTTPTSPWKRIRTLHTNASGRVATTIHPKHSGEFEAVYTGSSSYARATDFENFVVHPIVTSTLSSDTAAQGATVMMTGTVTPVVAHQKVTRQRLINGKWVAKGTTRVNRHGHFSFALRPSRTGTYLYRAWVGPAGHRASGHSHRVQLTVS